MSNQKYTNSLINESSPYLLQHAHNPVNWYPWNEEVLNKAQKENKIIIISIGYSACHWCHVMEHESFEDEAVAAFMNNHFISIKVDREERPDIDQIYMKAVQLLTNRGGWPLNCIALPDGRPIYGGTYFPKKQWLDMLVQIVDFVKNNPDKAEEQAQAITRGVQTTESIHWNEIMEDFLISDLHTVFSSWINILDYKEGGYKGAPKFPMPVGFQFLLHYYYLTGNQDALKSITITLDKMADGGIYDQIGGGFARYAVDTLWKVPHFEKMLYDNAQLVSLYSMAFQLTKYEKYRHIISETLSFIQNELTSHEGGFYSSLDADSEGEEGKFYVWTYKELQDLLGAKAEWFFAYFNIAENGNWENGKNILFRSEKEQEIAAQFKISELELGNEIGWIKSVLLNQRNRRVRPSLDDKILTSWNALMLKAYIDAYRVLGEPAYLQCAKKNASFIITEIKAPDNRLNRNYKNGKASINAFLDDYAFMISALISLYQATFDEKWLLSANDLAQYALNHFYDKTSGMFYYTSDLDAQLIVRKKEVQDNVIPSSNSEMAKGLFLLGLYFYNTEYTSISRKMLNNMKQDILRGGPYYSNWGLLLAWHAGPMNEIAIVGEHADAKRKEIDNFYLPNILLSGCKDEGSLPLLKDKLKNGKTMIYVCHNKVCELPTTDTEEALKQVIK